MAEGRGSEDEWNTAKSVWASHVVDFSSQYDNSGWPATAAVGPPKVYPRYGDIHGAWAQGNISNHEHISLGFSKFLYIDKLEIYETFHAGAVTRILARDEQGQWLPLWVNRDPPKDITSSRIFDVPLEPTKYKADAVRLEIDCTASGTWVEIDAVKLTGVKSRIEPPPPMTRLSDDLAQLVNSKEFSDVTFLVDGREVHGHRAILSARSDYFRAMFSEHTSKFCNTSQGEQIKMKDIGYDAFLIMMQYMYTNRILSEPSPTSLVEVMRAADMYSMMDLEKTASHKIHTLINTENVIPIYREAVEKVPVLAKLEKLCLEFITKNLQSVCKTQAFCDLPQEVMLIVIQASTENLKLS